MKRDRLRRFTYTEAEIDTLIFGQGEGRPFTVEEVFAPGFHEELRRAAEALELMIEAMTEAVGKTKH